MKQQKNLLMNFMKKQKKLRYNLSKDNFYELGKYQKSINNIFKR